MSIDNLQNSSNLKKIQDNTKISNKSSPYHKTLNPNFNKKNTNRLESSPLNTISVPYSEEAEKGILSCMFQIPKKYVSESLEKIDSDAFFFKTHKILFEEMVQLIDLGKDFDIVVISQILNEKDLMDKIGGSLALSEIWDFCSTTSHFEYFLNVVCEKYLLRKVIDSCTDSIKLVHENQFQPHDVLDEVERKILSIREEQSKSSIISMKQGVMDTTEHVARLMKDPTAFAGISTGINDLDKMTNGLQPGEMFVIAARPSVGKTSLAMNIVENVGIEQKIPNAVFTLEMSSQQLIMRMLCSRAGLQMQRVTGALMDTDDQERFATAAEKMKDSQVFFDDTGSISILELRSKARRLKRTHDIKLITIDYLQLMKSTSRKANDNRQIEISEISGGIKALAKELNIPIIVLAQLNRMVENREGKKPKLSDLRESGAIEQDADIVGLLVRDVFSEDDKDLEDEEKPAGSLAPNEAELIIAKQRNGPTGIVKLSFDKKYMRFYDVS